MKHPRKGKDRKSRRRSRNARRPQSTNNDASSQMNFSLPATTHERSVAVTSQEVSTPTATVVPLSPRHRTQANDGAGMAGSRGPDGPVAVASTPATVGVIGAALVGFEEADFVCDTLSPSASESSSIDDSMDDSMGGSWDATQQVSATAQNVDMRHFLTEPSSATVPSRMRTGHDWTCANPNDMMPVAKAIGQAKKTRDEGSRLVPYVEERIRLQLEVLCDQPRPATANSLESHVGPPPTPTPAHTPREDEAK
eukprot:m.506958 g.506958  ORF g.506958 m.506958 type:complete len:253 (-) comp84472_c0_seq1:109-867(-)